MSISSFKVYAYHHVLGTPLLAMPFSVTMYYMDPNLSEKKCKMAASSYILITKGFSCWACSEQLMDLHLEKELSRLTELWRSYTVLYLAVAKACAAKPVQQRYHEPVGSHHRK